MPTPRISIIIPTFNRAHLLGESIASALVQDFAAHEIIVVDDGSTDKTPNVTCSFGERARYLPKTNGGKSTALNWGIAHASGDMLLVLDDDDLLPPWALRAHLDALARNPQACFSYGRFSRFTGDSRNARLSTDIEPIPEDDDRRLVVKLMENCFLTNPTWMVRASAQRQVGPYRSELIRGQDYDMILRLARRFEGAMAKGIVLYQRRHFARRGSQDDATVGEDTIDKWIASDRACFAEYDESWDPWDFRPWDVSPDLAPIGRLTTIQRAVIMFLRKEYQRAEHHFTNYKVLLGSESPQRSELQIAAGLFNCRNGISDLIERDEPVSSWLRNLKLPVQLRRGLASSLRWHIRDRILAGQLRDAAKLLAFGRRSFGVDGLGLALGAPYSMRRSQSQSSTAPA